MRALLVLAGLTISLAAASQEIYRWVDKNGIVHYSDQPDSPDAKLIDVIEPSTYEGGEETDDDSAPALAGSGDEDEPGVPPYESLSIVSPTPDQVFFGGDAPVTVAANLDGTLRPDHSVVFFVNGNRRQADGLSLDLGVLERGTYFLRASILDQNGRPVITSQQTTFHVRQPSIHSPQSPQAPRPPSRPRPRPTPTPGN
jgi:Domain of unknown function (DUF4124)